MNTIDIHYNAVLWIEDDKLIHAVNDGWKIESSSSDYTCVSKPHVYKAEAERIFTDICYKDHIMGSASSPYRVKKLKTVSSVRTIPVPIRTDEHCNSVYNVPSWAVVEELDNVPIAYVLDDDSIAVLKLVMKSDQLEHLMFGIK